MYVGPSNQEACDYLVVDPSQKKLVLGQMTVGSIESHAALLKKSKRFFLKVADFLSFDRCGRQWALLFLTGVVLCSEQIEQVEQIDLGEPYKMLVEYDAGKGMWLETIVRGVLVDDWSVCTRDVYGDGHQLYVAENQDGDCFSIAWHYIVADENENATSEFVKRHATKLCAPLSMYVSGFTHVQNMGIVLK